MIPNNLNSFANNRSNYQMREQLDRMENEGEQQITGGPAEKSFFEKPPVAAKLDQKAPIAKPVEVNLSDRRIAQKRPETLVEQPTVMPNKAKTASLNQALENLAKQAITNMVVTKNTQATVKPAVSPVSTAKPKDPGYKPSQPAPTPSRPSKPVPQPPTKPLPTPVPTPTKPVITPAKPGVLNPPTNRPVITPAKPEILNPPTNKPVIAPAKPEILNPPTNKPVIAPARPEILNPPTNRPVITPAMPGVLNPPTKPVIAPARPGNTNPPTPPTSNNLGVSTNTNYYKDKPPETNTGYGSININSSKGTIGSSYTVSNTSIPNVQNIYNSTGEKIATVTTSYKLTDGSTTTRITFADKTTVDYSGKDTKIDFDSKGNVTSVTGNNANVTVENKKTPITISGNNTNTTLLGENQGVSVKGDNASVLVNQKGSIVCVEGNGAIINHAACTAKENPASLKGDSITVVGNKAFVDAGASTVTNLGNDAYVKGHNVNSVGNNCTFSGTEMLANDKISSWGSDCNAKTGNKTDSVNLYCDPALIKSASDAVNYSKNVILKNMQDQNKSAIERNIKDLEKEGTAASRAKMAELQKELDKLNKEIDEKKAAKDKADGNSSHGQANSNTERPNSTFRDPFSEESKQIGGVWWRGDNRGNTSLGGGHCAEQAENSANADNEREFWNFMHSS